MQLTEDGTIRIADTRVSLDSVTYHYKLGASAEQIVQMFPSLDLADVYATITYYLKHHIEIEEYLKQQTEGERLKKDRIRPAISKKHCR